MHTLFERDLAPAEIRYLETRIKDLKKTQQPFGKIVMKQALLGFGMAAVICLLGYLTSDSKPPLWFFLLIFWLPGGFWTAWFSYDAWKNQNWIRDSLVVLQDALRTKKAKVERIQSSRIIEVAEREDEGACYFFEVEPQKLFLLWGQEYYATARFPSSDFSLVDFLDSTGRSVVSRLQVDGSKLKPYKVIDAKSELKDLIPYDTTVLDCALDDLERYLKNRRRS